MQWEYKVVDLSAKRSGFFIRNEADPDNIEKQLCEIGNSGWELVSGDIPKFGTHTSGSLLIFKRPK